MLLGISSMTSDKRMASHCLELPYEDRSSNSMTCIWKVLGQPHLTDLASLWTVSVVCQGVSAFWLNDGVDTELILTCMVVSPVSNSDWGRLFVGLVGISIEQLRICSCARSGSDCRFLWLILGDRSFISRLIGGLSASLAADGSDLSEFVPRWTQLLTLAIDTMWQSVEGLRLKESDLMYKKTLVQNVWHSDWIWERLSLCWLPENILMKFKGISGSLSRLWNNGGCR